VGTFHRYVSKTTDVRLVEARFQVKKSEPAQDSAGPLP
jgi:hypothetical protein